MTDDCKPYRGYFLVTSSSGGVALVERDEEVFLFYQGPKYSLKGGFSGVPDSISRRAEPDDGHWKSDLAIEPKLECTSEIVRLRILFEVNTKKSSLSAH